MNIARALGDKFLKEEESAFSADPYISNVFRLSGDGLGLVVMARYVHNFCVLCTFNTVVHLNLCVHRHLPPQTEVSTFHKPCEIFTDKYFSGFSDGLWDVLSPRRALQLAAEV